MQRIISAGARIVLIIKRIVRFRRALALNRAKNHILSAMTLIPRAEVRKGKPYIPALRIRTPHPASPQNRCTILGRGEKLAAVLSAPGGFLGAVSRQVFSLCLGGVFAAGEKVRMKGSPGPLNASVFFLPSPKNLCFLGEVGGGPTTSLKTLWSCGFGPLTRPLPKIIS